MTDIVHALQTGGANLWIYIPTAILLGALHGLEPGHSKTMMAAFIIAVRGTVLQAVLLGLSAAVSHSLVIWLLAGAALHYGSQWNAEQTEPYLQLVSAAMIAGLAVWMFWQTRREVLAAHHHEHGHSHGHDHDHHHHHHHDHDESFEFAIGVSKLKLSIFEDGAPPVFRLVFSKEWRSETPPAENVKVETIRADGTRQKFAFIERDGFLESTTEIPEPHEFELALTIAHQHHEHRFTAQQKEHAPHDHGEYQDAHEAAHAREIQERFANRQVTTGQIVLFGLTGGLMPCPAAFTILLVCLQVKQFTLGFSMVAAFSLGLALTLVSVGVIAAWGVGHAQRKMKGFGELMRRAPYISCALLLVLATYMAWHGWMGIAGRQH